MIYNVLYMTHYMIRLTQQSLGMSRPDYEKLLDKTYPYMKEELKERVHEPQGCDFAYSDINELGCNSYSERKWTSELYQSYC